MRETAKSAIPHLPHFIFASAKYSLLILKQLVSANIKRFDVLGVSVLRFNKVISEKRRFNKIKEKVQ